ncbi:MAG TPA: cupin domain-containing protein [Candidatus Rubrimentiphilum sp.]|nr:cupin domain-containing protein [Candidatus Rubrimentiphilum sp.]
MVKATLLLRLESVMVGKNTRAVLSCALVVSIGSFTAALASDAPITVQSGAEHWVAGTGFMKGIGIATLVGNLNQSGNFVVRLRLPAGTKWPVHHHRYRLNATVLSGALLVGFGSSVDTTKMVRLPVGSFVTIPAGVNYYDSTVGVTVVQEEGMGPVVTTVIPFKR